MRELNLREQGIVAFYPPVDFTLSVDEKIATKRNQKQKKDALEDVVDLMEWGYIPGGTDLRDPRLSVTFASRKNLPKHVWIAGAEDDLLCREAEYLAEKLAAVEGDSARPIDGVPETDGWQVGGVRWEVARGFEHGWIHQRSRGREEARRRRCSDELVDRVGSWLVKEVYT